MPVELKTKKYRWRFMAVNPLTDELRHIGDVDELPEVVAKPFIKDQQLYEVPEDTVVGNAPRDEPSRLIGINISERDYLLGEHLRDQQTDGSFPGGLLDAPILKESSAAPDSKAKAKTKADDSKDSAGGSE